MTFTSAGTAQLSDSSVDIGTWGRFDGKAEKTVTLASRQTSIESFTITAPEDADPGDHIGSIVAEHTPVGVGNIRSIQRVAVRLYATLPGDARRDLAIEEVTATKDSWFYTRELTVSVRLRNTGRVRLEPTVLVDDARADGPGLIMSQSVEDFVVTRPVKFWGGPVRLRIDAQTTAPGGQAGPVRQLRVTTWVIPWHLFVLLAFLGSLVFLGRLAMRRRGGRYQQLQSDMRRIERLISQQGRDEMPADLLAERNDAHAAIRSAIKQARRAGDAQTAERLEKILDETSDARR